MSSQIHDTLCTDDQSARGLKEQRTLRGQPVRQEDQVGSVLKRREQGEDRGRTRLAHFRVLLATDHASDDTSTSIPCTTCERREHVCCDVRVLRGEDESSDPEDCFEGAGVGCC